MCISFIHVCDFLFLLRMARFLHLALTVLIYMLNVLPVLRHYAAIITFVCTNNSYHYVVLAKSDTKTSLLSSGSAQTSSNIKKSLSSSSIPSAKGLRLLCHHCKKLLVLYLQLKNYWGFCTVVTIEIFLIVNFSKS